VRENLCSIPVSEVFEPRDGCPICRMRDMLETRAVEFIMGDAMMDPDIRVQTNRIGFCEVHLRKMLADPNRLSLALLLHTRVAACAELIGHPPAKPDDTSLVSPPAACFTCEQIDASMRAMYETIYRQYGCEPEFRALVSQQAGLCLPHFRSLYARAEKRMPKALLAQFRARLVALTQKRQREVVSALDAYCRMHDYRSACGDWSAVRGAVEQGINYLTSREITDTLGRGSGARM